MRQATLHGSRAAAAADGACGGITPLKCGQMRPRIRPRVSKHACAVAAAAEPNDGWGARPACPAASAVCSGSGRGSFALQQQQQMWWQRRTWLVQPPAGGSSSSSSSSGVGSHVCRAMRGGSGGSSSGSGSGGPPDPWGAGGASRASPPPPPPPPPPGANGSNGNGWGYANSNGANGSDAPPGPPPRYDATDWGWDAPEQNWDPSEGLDARQRAALDADYAAWLAAQRAAQDPPRDKWITPLLDWQSIAGAFDPDQRRTEDAMADEALTNRSESREAIAFAARLVAVPLVTGALVGRALAEPVLSFTLANNPDAFAMTGRQKIEGAARVHQEEARVRMLMAIGQAPPLEAAGMMQHLREYAVELQEEERRHNEANLTTLVCDSMSLMVFVTMLVRDGEGRAALSSTLGRLFEGLSDIAKAVLIILVADTLLGYHSEEGWTGLIDVVLGHYGIEVEEKNIVLFVGVIPIAIDVLFKYWIFIGLNKISPGAVVTIKQLDRH